jgi:Fe-S cluster assembly ATPase SufC
MEDFMQVARTSTQVAWKRVYQDALFELDPNDLLAKLKVAERAIDERLDEVLSGGATDRRELTELQEAKRTIVFLRRQEQQIQTTVK